MASHLLSKSSFIKGLQCEKHLYLYKYHYDEMDELSEMQKAIFKRGTNVGELAHKLFPGGVIAAQGDPPKYELAIKRTKELINGDAQIIYEAAFMFNEVLSIADIFVMEKGGAKVYEVKSSTSISETYLNDAALQYYVISNLGIRVKDFSIIYINNQYVRKGDLDLEELFTTESVLELILPLQKSVKENVDRFKKVILKKKMPDIEIGEHCYNPYTCGFYDYCRKHIPENSIFDFSGMHLAKKFELYRNGIIRLDDVPEDYSLNKNNRLQLEVHKSGKPLIDKKAIKNFLSDLNYPLYFMDFETFQPAVPLFDNSKPYQQIPFQYSLFVKKDKNAESRHFEFLAEPGEDPRKNFIENLLKVTKGKGDVLVYNKTFEITRLNEIARDFPQYADEIEKLVSRIIDLMIPFQKKYYYAPEMKGSYSIKAVLPALVPELSYDELEINEGGLASVAYESLQTETDLMFIAEIKQQLLEYCKLDTLGMVRILEKLESIGGKNLMQAPVEILDFLESILSIFFYDIKHKERSVFILVDNLVELSCKARLRERNKQFNHSMDLKDILKIAGIGGDLKKRMIGKRKERNTMQHDLVSVTVSVEHCADSLIDFCELLRKLWGKSALDSAPEWVICSLRIAKLYSRSGDQDKRANLENYLEKYNWNLVLENEKITFQPALEKMELEFKSFTGIPIGRVKPNANEIVISIGSTKHWTLLLKKFHKEVTICLDDLGVEEN